MAEENKQPTQVSGGLGLGSTVVATVGNLANTALQNKYNEKARREQMENEQKIHDRDRKEFLDDRSHDEAYNSPAMQRFRRVIAGLNPNDGEYSPVATDSAGESPEGSLPDMESLYSKAPDVVGSALSVGESMATIRQKNAEAKRANADADLTSEKINVFGEEFELNKAKVIEETSEMRKNEEYLTSVINNYDAKTATEKENLRMIASSVRVAEATESCRIRTTLLDEKYAKLRNDEITQRLANLKKEWQQMDDYLAIAKYNAETSRIDANAHNRSSIAQSKLADSETEWNLQSFDTRMALLSNELSQSDITTENIAKITRLSIERIEAEIKEIASQIDLNNATIEERQKIAKAMMMNAWTNTICEPIHTLTSGFRDVASGLGTLATGGLINGGGSSPSPLSPMSDFNPYDLSNIPYNHFSWQRAPMVVNGKGNVNPEVVFGKRK